ncbi:MAG: glycoside hydrolase family 30 protein, partial [Cellulosilyticaceae bacterium]
INWSQTYQSIDGFGVSQAEWSDAIYECPEPARSQIMDLLFTQDGIDLDIFRGELFPTFATTPGAYDFTGRPDQVWIMQQARDRGVDKIISTTWSPPAWMKTNNQTTNGGYLKQECYSNYANLMAEFIKAYKELYGIDFYGISMANEPNSMTFLSWNSCEWNGDQVKDFLANSLKPEFEKQGLLGQVKIIAAEPSWWKEDLMKPALNDPTASSVLDIVAAHNYTVPILNTKQPQVPFDVAQSKDKRVWMTEVSSPNTADASISSGLFFAKEMHTFMTEVNANAYLFWTGAIPGSSDEGLINVDKATGNYTLTKRYYAFGNFSKFIKPNATRIDMPKSPVSGVYTSAYKDPSNNELIVVAINDTDATVPLSFVPNNINIPSFTPYVTSSTANLEPQTPITAVGGVLDTTLPPRSVVTYVGQVDHSPVPIVKNFYDSLDNLNKLASYTSGIVLDTSTPNKFKNDASRVKRNTETTESIVYHLPNIQSFSSNFYHNTQWDGVAFYTSSDGINWVKVPHVSTPGKLTAIGWYQKTYSSSGLITSNNNYLKIELSGPGAWNKQIGDVSITYKE